MYKEKLEDLIMYYKNDEDVITLINTTISNIINEITELTKMHIENKHYLSSKLKININIINCLCVQSEKDVFFHGNTLDEKVSRAVDMMLEFFMNGVDKEFIIDDTGFAGCEYLNSQK